MDPVPPASPFPPPGLLVRRETASGVLSIRRRWARPKHAAFALAAAALVAFVAQRWWQIAQEGGDVAPFLVLGSLFTLSFALRVLAALVNETTVQVDAQAIDVRHGPLPSLVFRPARLAREGVRDFEVRPWGPHHEVVAVLHDDSRSMLVRPLVTAEQAEYVRDVLRRTWSLPEGGAPPEPARAPEVATRRLPAALTALPVLVIPVIVVVAFFLASASDVEGHVSLGEGPESATFTPNDCRSGVPRGFFGVELTSDDAPGTIVRVVRDPIRGAMLAVESGGGAPRVFGPDVCSSLDLHVEQTSTNINDVWVLRGAARASCEGLVVDVRFDGCH